jgi:hypothetical protein
MLCVSKSPLSLCQRLATVHPRGQWRSYFAYVWRDCYVEAAGAAGVDVVAAGRAAAVRCYFCEQVVGHVVALGHYPLSPERADCPSQALDRLREGDGICLTPVRLPRPHLLRLPRDRRCPTRFLPDEDDKV